MTNLKSAKIGIKFNSLIFLLSLCFFTDQLGILSPLFNRLAGLFCYSLYIWNDQLFRLLWKKKAFIKLFSSLLLIIFGIIFKEDTITCCLLLIIAEIFRGKKTVEIKAGYIFFIYILLTTYVPFFYHFNKVLTLFFDFIFTPLNIHFSPYAYGMGNLILILAFNTFYVLSLDFRKTGKYKKILFVLSPIFFFCVLNYLYFFLSEIYFTLPAPKDYGLSSYFYGAAEILFPMNGQFFSLLFLFLFCFIQAKALKKEMKPLKTFPTYISHTIFIILLAAVLFFQGAFFTSIQKETTIHIYNSEMDFVTKPDETTFGKKNGMFGMLPDYIRDIGYSLKKEFDWTEVNPQRGDLIVLINPFGRPDEIAKVISFVEKGGRLLFLGDHTQMFGYEDPFFNLTANLGIRFNFDTATNFYPFWKNSLTSPFPDWNRMINTPSLKTGIMLGASLSITPPAVPVITGRYGWSDEGDINNDEGYLGDRVYTPNEKTGDLVLAAYRDYKKGRVLVFGDTAFLQNTPISGSWPLIKIALEHLLRNEYNLLKLIPAIVFIIISMGIFIFNKKIPNKVRSLPLSIWGIYGILFILLSGILLSIGHSSYFTLPEKSNFKRAGIDTTHFNDYFMADWHISEKGIGGLKNNIIRAGLLPYVIYENYSIENPEILFLMSPNKTITKKETDEYTGFIQNGGTLILSCGLEHRNQAKILLDSFNLDIENIPLSTLSGDNTDKRIHFLSAWPIKIKDVNTAILCLAWKKYPVIVKVKAGKGAFILIGDSRFFENRNLESGESYFKNNISFFKEFLKPEIQ